MFTLSGNENMNNILNAIFFNWNVYYLSTSYIIARTQSYVYFQNWYNNIIP